VVAKKKINKKIIGKRNSQVIGEWFVYHCTIASRIGSFACFFILIIGRWYMVIKESLGAWCLGIIILHKQIRKLQHLV